MKFSPSVTLAGCLALSSLAFSPARAQTPSVTTAPSQARIQQIVDKVKPSLVRIHVVSGVPENGRETKQESFGSGVIISPDGYVVTNHHVAGKARWLSVTLPSKEEVEAKLIGTDPLSDIAVIKLSPAPSGMPYPAVTWGDSSKLAVGDAVLAMGSPYAFSQSVTSGIVSNTELIFPSGMGENVMDGEDVGSIVRWIAHDAQIFPGNSGGPLVSLSGEIIGINEIGVGLSGAIPGDLARAVALQIIANGRVTRAYTGIDFQPRLRTDKRDSGVLVSGVLPGSPASLAGVKTGDLLLDAGGISLAARFPEQIPLANLEVSRLPVGKATPIKLLRGGETITVNLTPTQRDPAENDSVEVKGWGITCSNITPSEAREMRASGTDGAMVTTVTTAGPSGEAQPALQEDDVIVAVGGRKITSVAALIAQTKNIVQVEGGTPTLVEVQRNGERVLTVVSINKQSTEDTSVEVAKAWLPIGVQVVTPPLAKALGLPEGTKGVRVTQLYGETAPEAAAKFKVGDIITQLDGQDIEASQPEETTVFYTMLRQYKIGSAANLTVRRDGKPMTLAVPTVRAPMQERELVRYTSDAFGLSLRSVSYKDRANKDAGQGEQGALVTDIAKGGWAALAGLHNGDIIHSIGGAAVTNREDAEARLKSLEKERPQSVVLFISRGIHTLFVEIQTDYSLTNPPAAKTAAIAK